MLCYFRAVHNLIPLSLSHDMSSQVLLIMSNPEQVNRLGAQSSRERLLVPDTRAAFTSLSTQRLYIKVCSQCRSAVLIVHCLGSVKLQQTNNNKKNWHLLFFINHCACPHSRCHHMSCGKYKCGACIRLHYQYQMFTGCFRAVIMSMVSAEGETPAHSNGVDHQQQTAHFRTRAEFERGYSR